MMFLNTAPCAGGHRGSYSAFVHPVTRAVILETQLLTFARTVFAGVKGASSNMIASSGRIDFWLGSANVTAGSDLRQISLS